jgi:hypothetical protein
MPSATRAIPLPTHDRGYFPMPSHAVGGVVGTEDMAAGERRAAEGSFVFNRIADSGYRFTPKACLIPPTAFTRPCTEERSPGVHRLLLVEIG